MIALLLLASISRCATSALCPTDSDLIAAVRARDDAVMVAVAEEATAEGRLVRAHTQLIKNVSGVICSDQWPGDLPTITCKFTVRYSSQNAYLVARLIKRDRKWEIDDSLEVWRDRR